MSDVQTMSDRDLDVAIARLLANDPALFDRELSYYTDGEPIIYGSSIVPLYSSTGDGMLLVLEAMRERDWRLDICLWPSGRAEAQFTMTRLDHYEHHREVTASSLPRAVAEAAYSALQTRSIDNRAGQE